MSVENARIFNRSNTTLSGNDDANCENNTHTELIVLAVRRLENDQRQAYL